jgi:hypothetical protein
LAFIGQPNRFLTLTVNPAWFASPDERARELVRAWRNLRRRIMRDKKWKHLPFLAVFEQTKKGEPHLHIVLRCGYIDHQFISDAMLEMIGAPIIDIRAVKDKKQVAWYIAKYLGKDPRSYEGTKRYWRSKDWEDLAKKQKPLHAEDGATWKIVQENVFDFAKSVIIFGAREVRWIADSRFEAELPIVGPPIILRSNSLF